MAGDADAAVGDIIDLCEPTLELPSARRDQEWSSDRGRHLGMGIDTLLWSTGEASNDWARHRRTASREFSKVMVVASTVLGMPLVLGGLARPLGSRATGAWVVMGAGSMMGVSLVAWLWRRVPAMRLGAEFWDAEATVGSGGRRRGILILSASLLFIVIVGLALPVNQ